MISITQLITLMMELIGFEIPTKDDRLALKENKLLSSRNLRT